MLIRKAYYSIKFLIPRSLQIRLRRYVINRQLPLHRDVWPIKRDACKPPEGWSGWPEGKKFALVLTHDIETGKYLEKCQILAEIEERRGFRSSFNFVGRDYQIPAGLQRYLIDRGFEIGMHGWTHGRNPFSSRSVFEKQAREINRTLKEWGSVGFRSPSMYHNLEWLHDLDIEYDASTFDTDPFEPQPDGMDTIFPFRVNGKSGRGGYVELPYTLPQDYLLFILMRERTIDIWKKKLDWVAGHGGMALFIAHPNYMNFDANPHFDEYTARYYVEFLEYIESAYGGQYWHVLPREMARWWSERYGKPAAGAAAA